MSYSLDVPSQLVRSVMAAERVRLCGRRGNDEPENLFEIVPKQLRKPEIFPGTIVTDFVQSAIGADSQIKLRHAVSSLKLPNFRTRPQIIASAARVLNILRARLWAALRSRSSISLPTSRIVIPENVFSSSTTSVLKSLLSLSSMSRAAAIETRSLSRSTFLTGTRRGA
jgi:hypothetical protein